MKRAEIVEMLDELERAANEDKAAGRLVWGDKQLTLVKAIRKMLESQKAAQRAAWKRWYDKNGKLARIRREEREASRPAKRD